MKRQNFCAKCGSEDQIQEHHVHPQKHYGNPKGCLKVRLCAKHHRSLETQILAVEAFIYGKPFGRRYRLPRENYERILKSYLGDSKLVYT